MTTISAFYSVIAMLHNTKQGTWHPIVYFESPMPGPIDSNDLIRLKSKMHHTSGFISRELALQSITSLKEQIKENTNFGRITEELKEDIEWDGEGLPTDIIFRNKNDLSIAE